MAENKILIKNVAAIVCCNGRNDIYRDADIPIEGGKILEIGYGVRYDDVRILGRRDKFVHPDLVNIHHRLFQTFVRNLATTDYPNMLVVEQLNKIYRVFQRVDSDVIYYSSLTAVTGLVKYGCTTAFDHQYCFTVHTKKEAVGRQMEVASRIGIRYHTGRGTNMLPRSQGGTIPDDMRETIGEFIWDTGRPIHTYHDPGPFSMKRIVAASCQPVNCCGDIFIQSVKLAKETGIKFHTHPGEGENDIMEKRWGMHTLDWYRRIGFLGENTWLAHCWKLTDEEYRTLGASGCGISHCPSPVVLEGFPIPKMKKLTDYDVFLSLGCDGSTTNDNSNLLDSIRTACTVQCHHSKERGDGVSAYEILKQATVSGTGTFGREDIGSLEEDKAADLFMVDARALGLAEAVHDPRNIIDRVGLADNVYVTMVNGRVVYENGRPVSVGGRGLAKEGERICDRVPREPCEAFRSLFWSNLF